MKHNNFERSAISHICNAKQDVIRDLPLVTWTARVQYIFVQYGNEFQRMMCDSGTFFNYHISFSAINLHEARSV
jgi:hypothetical protein